MKYSLTLSATLLAMVFAGSTAYASEVFVYPANGQSAEQQKKDEFECYGWAKDSSGFDPMAPPTTTSARPSGQKKSGGAARGALGGALLGAAIGDRSKYAGRGAVAGGLIGGARQSSHNKQVEAQQAQWERDQAAQYQQRRNSYNRAYSACLEGRGYTVN